jgi:hypothetical protein
MSITPGQADHASDLMLTRALSKLHSLDDVPDLKPSLRLSLRAMKTLKARVAAGEDVSGPGM